LAPLRRHSFHGDLRRPDCTFVSSRGVQTAIEVQVAQLIIMQKPGLPKEAEQDTAIVVCAIITTPHVHPAVRLTLLRRAVEFIDAVISRVKDSHCGETQRMDDLKHGPEKLARGYSFEGPPLNIGSLVRGIPMRNRELGSPLYYFPSGLDLYRPVLGIRVDKISNLPYWPFQRLT
jgi:hypothetical protein